ncbi:hypothetical protein M434DRAFT_31776 [Hypoxylon sp. CO27-5]|nr:hypothetical protein M434DRAFT_31776 [Hypoxylon sp. CO27-5]
MKASTLTITMMMSALGALAFPSGGELYSNKMYLEAEPTNSGFLKHITLLTAPPQTKMRAVRMMKSGEQSALMSVKPIKLGMRLALRSAMSTEVDTGDGPTRNGWLSVV